MESSRRVEGARLAEKYDRLADGFSEHEYADPVGYAMRRARLIVELGPRLGSGDHVLDLCCADGVMAAPLMAYGLHYRGVDISEAMVKAAMARCPTAPFHVARCEEYVPPEPVEATICLRSFYQPASRLGFFRHVASYTREKFVFDFEPRTFEAAPIVADLLEAGFAKVELRPFFLPQRRRVPGFAVPLLAAFERVPFASVATKRFGCMFCVATL